MTSHALGELASSRRMLQQQEVGGRHGRHLKNMTSYQKSDCQKSDCQSMRIFLENNLAKFHTDPI